MKKLLLIIILFLLFTINVNAEEKTVFSVNSTSAKPGDEVTISINMSNNPKFQSLAFFIPLNSIYVEFKSCSINGFNKATMKDCDINPRNEITFYAIQASDADNKLFTDTGNILEVKLKVKDDVKEDIPITLDMKNFARSTSEKLEYDVVNGIIKITGDFENKEVNSKDDLSGKVLEDVVWSSSDDSVATVDDKGKVTFNESGNTTITAKNKDGKTVYEKTYSVNKKDKKSINKFVIIGLVAVIIIVFVFLTIFFIKNKKSKN